MEHKWKSLSGVIKLSGVFAEGIFSALMNILRISRQNPFALES